MNETLRVTRKAPLIVGRMGHWRMSDPNGVECPFCETWNNLPERKCPKCYAILKLARR